MGVIAKGILRDCQGLFTPVSLGYPLSVFNKKTLLSSALRKRQFQRVHLRMQFGPICVCVSLQIQVPLFECGSIRSGASGLPYYCTPPACVPDVIGGLTVWRQNTHRKKGGPT